MSFRTAAIRPIALATAALTAGALFSAGMGAAAASAAPVTPTLTIHLTTAAGKAATGSEIVFFPSTDNQINTNDIFSDENAEEAREVKGHPGTYTVSLGAAGQYTALLLDAHGEGESAQWLGGAQFFDPSAAKYITIPAGNSALDLAYAGSGTISGTVKNTAGKPVADVCVETTAFDGSEWLPSFDLITGDCAAWTNSKGAYSFNPGSAGSYHVQFAPTEGNYITQFSNGATDEDDATPVYLAAGKSAVVNTTLATGGTLKGSIPGVVTRDTDLELSVYPLDGTSTGISPDFFGQDVDVDGHGNFSTSGLATGHYALQYDLFTYDSDSDEGEEDTTGFIGGVDAQHATVFSVTAGHTTSTGPLTLAHADPTDTGEADFQVLFQGTPLSGQAGVQSSDDGDHLVLYSSVDGTQYEPEPTPATATTYKFKNLPAGSYQAFEDNPIALPAEADVTVAVGNTTDATIELQPATPLAFTIPPSVSGTAAVGSPLTVDPGTLNRDSGTQSFGYQWYRSVDGDKELIRGEHDATYTPRSGDAGDELFVRVYGDFVLGYGVNEQPVDETSQLVSAGTIVASTTPITNTVAPQIVGAANAYTPVHVDGGAWSVTGPKLSYQWRLDGDPIDDATSASYTPDKSVLGEDLSVTVTASKAGYPDSAGVTTDSVSINPGFAPTVITAPKFTAKTSAGTRKFVAGATKWSVAGGTTHYEWTVDGAAAGTDSATFLTTFRGAVSLEETYSVTGYYDATWSKLVARGVLPTQTTQLFDINQSIFVPLQPGATVGVGDGLASLPASAVLPDGSSFTGIKQALQVRSGKSWVNVKTHSIPFFVTLVQVPSSALGKTGRIITTATSANYAPLTLTSQSFVVTKNDALRDVGSASIPSQLPAGQTAKVSLSSFPSGVSHKYQWQLSSDGGDTWAPIPGAKSSTLVLGATIAVGDIVRVDVTSSSAASNPATIQSDSLTVLDNHILATTGPQLSAAGPIRVGASVSATAGTWNVAGTTSTYQWQVSDDGDAFTDIVGATSSKYTARAGDAGKFLRANVTATRTGYLPSTVPTAGIEVDAIPGDSIAVHSSPIVGNQYDASITAPDWNTVFTSNNGLPGSTVKYAWKLNGKTVAGATSSSYTARVADIGKKLQVTESLTSGVYGSAVYTTAAVTIAKGDAPEISANVSGTTQAGSTVTAAFSFSGAAKLQWRTSVDGSTWTNVTGATKSTFTIPLADAGRQLDFVVTAAQTGHVTAVVPSAPVGIDYVGTLANQTAPTISDPKVGVATTVDTGTWNKASGLVFTYQWFNDGNVIPGATSSTFTPLGSDASDDLSVAVSASAAGWVSAASSSDEVAVARGTISVTKNAVITGSAKTCSTLSVSAATWSASGVVVTYQWFDGDVALTGATASTYQVSPGQLGSQLSVQLTATAIGYQAKSFTTLKTAPVALGTTTCAP